MHNMNLRAIDLNLLVILDALLAEQSVTRAASHLHLSQPAVSHALDRLRSLFDDPLLERRGAQMALTARAEAIKLRLSLLLAEAHELIDPPQIPLLELQQTVRLSMADYPCAVLLPMLWSRLQRIAPGIQLVCQDWRDGARELERLQRGEVDIALSLFPEVPADICQLVLGREDYVGIARRDHPIAAAPDIEAYCRYPHVLVSASGALRTPFDALLAEQGLQRRVGLSVSSFLAVPSVVAASDALALVPRLLAQHWPGMAGVRQFTPPLSPPPYPAQLGYHRRRSRDAGVMAVVDCIKAICAEVLMPV
ncbi:LysR family transcriptional regulator [Chitinimonas sp.]|uniref:LysR family transcriptional regulator n=1 Tax=Chitinimonas sp. TaxID=1934313 RepID=UPI0035AD83E0